jgi:hypothetical protein
MSFETPVKAGHRAVVVAAIADGAALSAAVDLGTATLAAVVIPEDWEAAGLTFQASHDGVAWVDLIDADGEVAFTVAADQMIALDPAVFYGLRHLKLRSGTAATPVNQTTGPLALALITVP